MREVFKLCSVISFFCHICSKLFQGREAGRKSIQGILKRKMSLKFKEMSANTEQAQRTSKGFKDLQLSKVGLDENWRNLLHYFPCLLPACLLILMHSVISQHSIGHIVCIFCTGYNQNFTSSHFGMW